MNIILNFMLIYYIYLSIFVKSININVNNFDIISNRIRNYSLRFVVFNKFYKNFKGNLIVFIKQKKKNYILESNNSYLKANYYEICYRYYSMSEDDRNNLEFIVSLLY